jgi:hypothetical protein
MTVTDEARTAARTRAARGHSPEPGTDRAAVVYGAYGHTGRFVVAELCRRGWTPVLSGRDARKLDALGLRHPMLERRAAAIDDDEALDRALAGAAVVINCAGPFLDTASPLIEAAMRSGSHYLDVTAEQQAVLDAFERYAEPARRARVAVLPGMAFYGGLADLLATKAMGGRREADTIEVAVALDGWHPTEGTRLTGQRNHYRRKVVANGRLDVLPDPPPRREWSFAGPFGVQPMVELPFSETITIARHLEVRELHSFLNCRALEDVRDARTPAPVAIDEQGRSAQRFAMEVRVQHAGQQRRIGVSGQDIYAITAPLVVEAATRLVDGRGRGVGVLAAGEAFDASDFLAALAPLLQEHG